MKEVIICFILFFCILSIAQTGEASTAAYIYSSDNSSAIAYESLLESSGFTTDLILTGNVSVTNFSKYDLIIIGNEVGVSGLFSDAQNSDIVKINSSGKPIIGLGYGGAYFFGSLGLVTDYMHSWVGKFTSIIVMDDTHSIFNKPNSIPANKILQLYSPPPESEVLAVYLPDIPANVTVLGMEILSDEKHYSFTLENSRYMHWGFTASPTYMTQTGKDLFINSAYFLVNGTTSTPEYIPAPKSTLLPAQRLPGFEAVFAMTGLLMISFLMRKEI